MNINQLTTKLASRLKRDLPGKSAQQTMLAKPLKALEFSGSYEHAIPSAVLILLFPKHGETHFYLTERTQNVQYHKGQISLPGGAWEAGEQLPETAIRETEEEIGVQRDSIQMIDGLTPLFIPATGFMIHPFVGWMKSEPDTFPDTTEVKTLFSVSIQMLMDEKICKRKNQTIRGIPFDIPYFQFDQHQVWGATSMILSEFKAVLKDIL